MAYKDKSKRPRKGTGWKTVSEWKTLLIGNKVGRLTVLSNIGLINGTQRWECLCDCGVYVQRRTESFKRMGDQNSCGCLSNPKRVKHCTKHGLHKSAEYTAYNNMKDRCGNPKNKEFHRYGARGITVCQRWLDSFENFLEDVGMRPDKDLSLDRINNDLGYFKDNCRWATRVEQANNFRRNRYFFHDGTKDTMANHCRKTGVKKSAILHRVKSGLSYEDAFLECLRIKEAS